MHKAAVAARCSRLSEIAGKKGNSSLIHQFQSFQFSSFLLAPVHSLKYSFIAVLRADVSTFTRSILNLIVEIVHDGDLVIISSSVRVTAINCRASSVNLLRNLQRGEEFSVNSVRDLIRRVSVTAIAHFVEAPSRAPRRSHELLLSRNPPSIPSKHTRNSTSRVEEDSWQNEKKKKKKERKEKKKRKTNERRERDRMKFVTPGGELDAIVALFCFKLSFPINGSVRDICLLVRLAFGTVRQD